MGKILLSYSTLNDYTNAHHSYINKLFGIKQPETPAMFAGKEAHKTIQAHCLGTKKDDRLKDLTWDFMQDEYHARKDYNDKYQLHGFIDMVNWKSKVICEIKTSATPKGQSWFNELIQWRYYSMVTGLRKVLFIMCKPDLSELKTFYQEVTDEDIAKAEKFVKSAVEGIDNGLFTDDLLPGKICPGIPKCWFRERCFYAPTT
jgi:hypothetical protein